MVGTYVERRMEQFLRSRSVGTGRKPTDIDELVLFEQRVNLVNGPVILMQLLWILASSSVPIGAINTMYMTSAIIRNEE